MTDTLLYFVKLVYINKLAPQDLSLDEFKDKISWRYDFEKPFSSISKNSTYRNNLLINRCNAIAFSLLCNLVQSVILLYTFFLF